jgi:hypothetical protein
MKVIDPLAQSFYIENRRGAFITSVDLYFLSKDDDLPVTVQLRPMELGVPTKKVYPFGEVILDPKDIQAYSDASVPTRVTFPSPVYLKGQTFHALVIISQSQNYNVWVSRLGEIDVSTISQQESSQLLVTKQPVSGGLFKSQNASTWNESPYEDLKFTLYRANFTQGQGNFSFYNPESSLGNGQVATLVKDSLEFSSNKIRVGLGTTVQDSNLTFGNTILQKSTNAIGNYVAAAGIAKGNLTLVNAGVGYTPTSGSFTYNGVSLSNVTGNGRNATANITISNGVAIAATISNGGTGYVVGDVLTASQIGTNSLGRNLRISVSELSGVNELIIDNVQGEFEVGTTKAIQYVNNSGITTDLNSSVGGNVRIPADGIQVETDGLHIKVNHRNHGMHAGENIVKISNVIGNIKPIKLTAEYTKNSNQNILVDSTISFSTFENVGVSNTNPGYVLIGNEIISYEGVTTNSLTGITRGIDQTLPFSYSQGTSVYKYELNGISLRRINTTHTLQDATVSDPVDFDYYTIKINTSQNGKTDALPYGQVDRSVGTFFPKLHANETKSTGGSSINCTQNIQYEIATPNIQTTSVNGTNITASIRTVSGTSVDGVENSFLDKGFTNVKLYQNNYFDSPRIVCSKVNEDERLSTLPAKKSLTVDLALSTSNSYISPTVDLDRSSVIFTTNRINSPIENYATDNRVSTIVDDPSSFIYATNSIQLEIPATSLKVLVTAYVNTFSDVRALYSIKSNPNDSSIFYPFPGYSNLTEDGRVISQSLSDGTSDKRIVKTNKIGYNSGDLEYKEYEFTVNNLSPFKYFSIKLIGSGTNQAFPPRLSDLRVVALA